MSLAYGRQRDAVYNSTPFRLTGRRLRTPVVGRLARARRRFMKVKPLSASHQLVGALGHLGAEVVHQAPQRRLLVPALTVQLRAAWGADDSRLCHMKLDDFTPV
jgi:hypothetical protein